MSPAGQSENINGGQESSPSAEAHSEMMAHQGHSEMTSPYSEGGNLSSLFKLQHQHSQLHASSSPNRANTSPPSNSSSPSTSTTKNAPSSTSTPISSSSSPFTNLEAVTISSDASERGQLLESFFKSPSGDLQLLGKGTNLRHEINNNNNSPGLQSSSYNEYHHPHHPQQQHRYGSELSHNQHSFHNLQGSSSSHHPQQIRSNSMSALSLSAYQQQQNQQHLSGHHTQVHPYNQTSHHLHHPQHHHHPGKVISGGFNLYASSPDAAGYATSALYGGVSGSSGISHQATSFGNYAEYPEHLGSGISGSSGGIGTGASSGSALIGGGNGGGNDLDIDFDSVCPGQSAMLECDVDQVIRHELSVDGSLDFTSSLLPSSNPPPRPLPPHSPSLPHLHPFPYDPSLNSPHDDDDDDDELGAETNGAVSSFTTTTISTNATPTTPSTTSRHNSPNMPFTMLTTEQQSRSRGGNQTGDELAELQTESSSSSVPMNSGQTTFYGPSRPEGSASSYQQQNQQQQYVTLTSLVSDQKDELKSGYSLLQRQLSLGNSRGEGEETFISMSTSSPTHPPPTSRAFEGGTNSLLYGPYFSNNSSPNGNFTSNFQLNSSSAGEEGSGGVDDHVHHHPLNSSSNYLPTHSSPSLTSPETVSVVSVTSPGAVSVVSPHHHQTPSALGATSRSWVH